MSALKDTLKNLWLVFYRKHPYLSNLFVAIVCFALFLGLVSLSLSLFTRHGQSRPVPDFTGQSLSEAYAMADEHKLELIITDSVFVNTRTHGTVFRQIPQPGTHVKKGRRIFVVVNSMQPRMIPMPNVVGYSLRQAKAVLTAAGLHVGKLNYVNDMATNNVLGQKYRGRTVAPETLIPAESDIDLEIGKSDWNEGTLAPLLIGHTLVQAKDRLAESSLNTGTVRYDQTVKNYSDSLLAKVYKQSPEVSETEVLRLGAPVNLWLTIDETKLEQ